MEGSFPNLSKAVAIVAPHTSNWDWVVGTLVTFAIRIRAHYFAKHTLFRGPMGWVLRRLGGIPIDRAATRGAVEQMVEEFARRDRLVLGVTPEGTRKAVDRWRTGFYYVALGAEVPIVPIYMDWPRKVFGFGPPFSPTGDAEADIASLQAFYRPYQGKNPQPLPASVPETADPPAPT